MNLIEKLRAKQREFDRMRWRDHDCRNYDADAAEMADLLGLAAATLEGQSLLIDHAQKPA